MAKQVMKDKFGFNNIGLITQKEIDELAKEYGIEKLRISLPLDRAVTKEEALTDLKKYLQYFVDGIITEESK